MNIIEKNKRKQRQIDIELQTSWLEEELKKRISIQQPNKVIFVGIISRSNTGALSTVLGRAPIEDGITRHIQPIKAIARRLMKEHFGLDSSTPLEYFKDFLEIDKGVHLVKETIGPNRDNPSEWLNGFHLLLAAGLDPHKSILVPTFREPLDTAISWMKSWKLDLNKFPFTSFNESYIRNINLWNDANRMGITVVPYIHEFLRDIDSNKVVSAMCNQIKLPFSERMVAWGNEDAYWSGRTIKYDAPPDDWIRGSLGSTHGGKGGFVWEPIISDLTLTEIEFIKEKTNTSQVIWQEAARKAHQLLNL